jgi:hypothetical protein
VLPGGTAAGFNDAVAPEGIPCKASRIGLANAAPWIATLNWNVATVPIDTVCLDAPELASVKSETGAATVTTELVDDAERKFVSPEYTAVMLWVPAARLGTVNAVPTCTVPSNEVPSISDTVPVGTPEVVLATCGVRTRGVPGTSELAETARLTLAGALAITTEPVTEARV